MLRTIRKLLGEKSNQIKFPIALMGADAVLSIVFKSHFIRLMQAVRLTCGTYAEPYLYGYSGGGVGK